MKKISKDKTRFMCLMKTILFLLVVSLITACGVVDESEEEFVQLPKNPKAPSKQGKDIDTNILYSHGPLKLMMPEQILNSISTLTGHDFGIYDFLVPNNPTPSEFYQYCVSMGGCPDHVSLIRATDIAFVYVLTLDKVASTACRDATVTGMIPPGVVETITTPTDAEIDQALDWQYKRFFGTAPLSDELEISRRYVKAHLAGTDFNGEPTLPENDTPNPTFGTALRGHCIALSTSSKFIYF